ncbi:carbonic anhydrase [Niastella caeni]|uniref:Carbonic anhydrase n=1 Tax=Niastella caeni TaxID=2569763 RepID=A0A4S8HCG1_9BACT|nr:carbonic anhydrase [Niastella caeni]THU32537.1 carbonic anhydrase [Niastella caeni]
MKKLFLAAMAIQIAAASFAQSQASKDVAYAKMKVSNTPGSSIYNDLMLGNKRFARNHPLHPHQDTLYMHKLSSTQHPKAIVLTCSDSRVSPEIVFDQGLGDLFVIRNAGNVVDNDVLGSIEYAIEHLGVTTIIVLGHESCGAVTATVNHLNTNNHIMDLEKSITPAYRLAENKPGNKVHNTVVQNVELSIEEIRNDKSLLPATLHLSDISIYGAVYDLATGVVTPVSH